MARNTIFPAGTEIARVEIMMPVDKRDELKRLALIAGLGTTDYIRFLLFSHMLREADKAKNND